MKELMTAPDPCPDDGTVRGACSAKLGGTGRRLGVFGVCELKLLERFAEWEEVIRR